MKVSFLTHVSLLGAAQKSRCLWNGGRKSPCAQ